tara:strand:- start:646 stop:1170 length:525 start_codon:yes stop_codon:yes gene_type:complete
MQNYSLALKFLPFLLINCLILTSCSAKLTNIKHSEPKIINLEENFIIEGKFKLQINSLIEKGYFILNKKNSLIHLSFRNNFLSPERTLLFNVQDKLNLGDFSEEVDEKKITTSGIISLEWLLRGLSGDRDFSGSDGWNAKYPEGFQLINGYKVPYKIDLYKKNVKLQIVLKKMR